jgi:hypothetical protein
MGRKMEKLNIKNATFKYSGTNTDLTLFLKTIIRDYLIKNNIISESPLQTDNNASDKTKSVVK